MRQSYSLPVVSQGQHGVWGCTQASWQKHQPVERESGLYINYQVSLRRKNIESKLALYKFSPEIQKIG